MSEQSIYLHLRSGGLSPAGTAAMMGNMWCESTLKSDIVEKRCSMSDRDYTYNVDNGLITKWQFETDAYGYGLCQWTYCTRKEALYLFAKDKGVSIGDEQMQCEFCIAELQKDYAGLYQSLCNTDDLPTAAKRICSEYEQPAVNNYADRINAAQRFFNQLAYGGSADCNDACPVEPTPAKIETIPVRVLKQGDLGRDVYILQCGLIDMRFDCGVPDGDFGLNTKEAVAELQRAYDLPATGIADSYVWQTIMRAR